MRNFFSRNRAIILYILFFLAYVTFNVLFIRYLDSKGNDVGVILMSMVLLGVTSTVVKIFWYVWVADEFTSLLAQKLKD